MSRDFQNALSGLQIGCLQQSLMLRKGNVRTPSSLPVMTSSIAKHLDFVSRFRDRRGRIFFFSLRKTNRWRKSRRVLLSSGSLTKLAHSSLHKRETFIFRVSLSHNQSVFISFLLFVSFDIAPIFNQQRCESKVLS